jgi:hypothetical protein
VKLSARQIYAALRQAGFSPAKAVVMTAIAYPESGGRTDAQGDTSIQTDKWGPSYGLFQVRTLKAETGTGGYRDIVWLQGSIANQAKAAYAISGGGQSFTPWTAYTSGAYRRYLSRAQSAARAVGADPSSIALPDAAAVDGGLSGLVPGASSAEGLMSSARDTVLMSGFALGGIVLVALGAVVATKRRPR